MAHKIAERLEVAAGIEIEMANKTRDAPIILIEGLGGLIQANGILKLNLFQQYVDSGKVVGIYNAILAIPTPIFLQIEEILHKVAEEIKDSVPAEKLE